MPTIKQRKAAQRVVENHGNISRSMIEAGYDETTAKNPKNLTDSKGWRELMEEYLSDIDLAQKHQELLNATGIDHMVFPPAMSDQDIVLLLEEVNCKVKKFMHGDTQTHVWFFSADNKARKDALDMAYKLKGQYAPEKSVNINANINIENAEELRGLAKTMNQEIRKEYEQGDGVNQ